MFWCPKHGVGTFQQMQLEGWGMVMASGPHMQGQEGSGTLKHPFTMEQKGLPFL